MSAAFERPMASARLRLGAGAAEVDVAISVPADAVLPHEVLPAIRKLQNELVSAAERAAARQGRSISCRAGCGACCRQPVPLADVEVEAIAALVEHLPEPRRTLVRTRFAEAEARLAEAGMLERLRDAGERGEDGPPVRALANQYFKLGIACPFLELESCSIYADRPVTCRSYIVTSPAEFCSDIESRDIKTLPVLHLSPALQAVGGDEDKGPRRWTAMVLALDRQRVRPPLSQRRPGPHWIQALLEALRRVFAG